MDLTACQPTWVMLCRNELCQKIWKKRINKIILSVDSNLNMMKFKVCIGDLTDSCYVIGRTTETGSHYDSRGRLHCC